MVSRERDPTIAPESCPFPSTPLQLLILPVLVMRKEKVAMFNNLFSPAAPAELLRGSQDQGQLILLD